MEIYRVTIKKGKKKLAVFEFVAAYADDAVNAARDIYFDFGETSVKDTGDITYVADCLGKCKETIIQLISSKILVRR
jgi:hypothetical protein